MVSLEKVQQLKDMGFSTDQAESALLKTGGSVERAIDSLVSEL